MSPRSTSQTPANASHQEAAGLGNSDSAPLAPETTWQCSKCEKPVNVGTGGQYNYDVHQRSGKCKKAEAALKKKRSKEQSATLLRNFFKEPATKTPATVPTPPRVQPLPRASSSSPPISRTYSPAPAASSRASSYEPASRITNPPDSDPPAPTIEDSGADLTSIAPTTTSDFLQPAATAQASATANPATAPHTAVAEELLSAKRIRTDNLECICGKQVTEDQRVSSAVKCGRSGCETVWFHEDCAASGGKPGWVCESCKPTKKRR
ncbi:hypothetical protein R3P38DRAFT_3214299 [Favolaschia claudopus]|uniref:Zinc finger PHD-type domain-containing protein n=1 Tax=Favolaschia claudopus TaxID=2862362 RepID=A0AAW0ABP6_9AGAR